MTTTAETAFVIMDLQNDVAHPDSKGSEHGPLAEAWQSRVAEIERKQVLQNTRAVLDRVRPTDMMVIHVAILWRPGYPELGEGFQIFDQVKAFGGFQEGSWGAQFHDTVAPVEGEIVIGKRRINAFYESDLDLILRSNNIKRIVAAGAATVFVVESTVRDAADRGYDVVTLSDCCASFDAEQDAFLLDNVFPMFGRVTTSQEFLAELGV